MILETVINIQSPSPVSGVRTLRSFHVDMKSWRGRLPARLDRERTGVTTAQRTTIRSYSSESITGKA